MSELRCHILGYIVEQKDVHTCFEDGTVLSMAAYYLLPETIQRNRRLLADFVKLWKKNSTFLSDITYLFSGAMVYLEGVCIWKFYDLEIAKKFLSSGKEEVARKSMLFGNGQYVDHKTEMFPQNDHKVMFYDNNGNCINHKAETSLGTQTCTLLRGIFSAKEICKNFEYPVSYKALGFFPEQFAMSDEINKLCEHAIKNPDFILPDMKGIFLYAPQRGYYLKKFENMDQVKQAINDCTNYYVFKNGQIETLHVNVSEKTAKCVFTGKVVPIKEAIMVDDKKAVSEEALSFLPPEFSWDHAMLKKLVDFHINRNVDYKNSKIGMRVFAHNTGELWKSVFNTAKEQENFLRNLRFEGTCTVFTNGETTCKFVIQKTKIDAPIDTLSSLVKDTLGSLRRKNAKK